MEKDKVVFELETGCCVLGIELGSTRIKAILISSEKKPVASGSYDWENLYENGIWTYHEEDIQKGLAECYSNLKKDVFNRYGVVLRRLSAIGVSAMMHGYMAFDSDDRLLTPFKTWRNTITGEESAELTELFDYPIPQRWTVSHLLYEIKMEADYLNRLDHVSTLSSYVHKLLTGEKVVGIGDASGMFPIDVAKKNYDAKAAAVFFDRYGYDVFKIFPKVLVAGDDAGTLCEFGAWLLDSSGDLEPGCPMCPPEGDAGTGMVATNSVLPRTGNVSAGTSAFAMVVLEKPLAKTYKELDLVTTPDGSLVAMAHTNNCTGNYDAWLSLFNEVLSAFGVKVDKAKLYDMLLSVSMASDADCGGLLSYNYISGEPITGLDDGYPMFIRPCCSSFNLANFMRSELYSAVAAMRVGLDILFEKEGVSLDVMSGHGGFFKTADVGLRIMASALKTPIRALSTAGEGGAWGIAILASYVFHRDSTLAEYLSNEIFADSQSITISPAEKDCQGFENYYRRYLAGLAIEKTAVKVLDGKRG